MPIKMTITPVRSGKETKRENRVRYNMTRKSRKTRRTRRTKKQRKTRRNRQRSRK